jgi:hypothetical protein
LFFKIGINDFEKSICYILITLILVIGFFPVFSFAYFLHVFFNPSIKFSYCLLFFKENVLVSFNISSSNPSKNSSFSKIGKPLTFNKGLLPSAPLLKQLELSQ